MAQPDADVDALRREVVRLVQICDQIRSGLRLDPSVAFEALPAATERKHRDYERLLAHLGKALGTQLASLTWRN